MDTFTQGKNSTHVYQTRRSTYLPARMADLIESYDNSLTKSRTWSRKLSSHATVIKQEGFHQFCTMCSCGITERQSKNYASHVVACLCVAPCTRQAKAAYSHYRRFAINGEVIKGKARRSELFA